MTLDEIFESYFSAKSFQRRPDPDGIPDWNTGIPMESDATFKARIKSEMENEEEETK